MTQQHDEEIDIERLYHRNTSRDDCIRLLLSSNQIGTYLIRKSVTINSKVLSVLVTPGSPDGIYNYILSESIDGRIGFSSSKADLYGLCHQKWRFYDTLQSLIKCCSSNESPLKVPLTNPIYADASDDDQDSYIDMTLGDSCHRQQDMGPWTENNDRSEGAMELRDIKGLLKHLKCAVCSDIAENAIETCCCCQLFCEKCYGFGEYCKFCKKPSQIQIPRVLHKIIEDLPAMCSHSGCSVGIRRSELRDHEAKCDYQLKTCVFHNCNHMCRNRDMLEHVIAAHPAEALSRLENSRTGMAS